MSLHAALPISLAGLIAIAMVPAGAVVAPASAQIGGIVHDPRNYAQNMLTAARTLEQINNQIKQRSEEHTSELQSLMRISYAVFCLKKKKQPPKSHKHIHTITTQKNKQQQ